MYVKQAMCSVIPCGTVLSSNVKETFVEFSWNFTSVRKIDEKESTTNDEGGAKFSRSPFSSNGTRTYTIWHRVPCQSKVKCFPFYGTPFVRIRSNVYFFFSVVSFNFLLRFRPLRSAISLFLESSRVRALRIPTAKPTYYNLIKVGA